MHTFAKKPMATQQNKSGKSTKSNRAFQSQSRDPGSFLHLQRTIGNHAAHRLLQAEPKDLKASSASNMLTGFTYDFSRIPLHPPTAGAIQTLEEDPLQGKFNPDDYPNQPQADSSEVANHTGIPGRLKSGLESLSGIDLSGVRVHRNSAKPDQVNALAYTQGQDIHVGPGQEKHLPHEGWHVVQQMQGRVKPTIQDKWASINDDMYLEQEADVMGRKALRMTQKEQATSGGESELAGEAKWASEDMVDLNSLNYKAGQVQTQLRAPVIQKQAAVSVASFALSLATSNQGSLTYTNITCSRSRPSAGNTGTPIDIDLVRLRAKFGLGDSEAFWKLRLHTDGDNIISAHTEFKSIDGFDGGLLGTTGAINFAATPYGGTREQPTKILITCSGNLDPSGFGYVDYAMSFIVGGDGSVVRNGATITNVAGNVPSTFYIHSYGSGYGIESGSREHAEEFHESDDYLHDREGNVSGDNRVYQ